MIGQAEGILIGRERIYPEQAFTILRTASQNLNSGPRDRAHRIVDTGEVPER